MAVGPAPAASCARKWAASTGISSARAQRRNLDLEDFEPVHQTGTKVPCAHRLIRIAVGGGHDAHVHLAVGQGAQTAHAQILQHAQQPGLQTRVEPTDFVQKQSTAVGGFNQPELAGMGSGKRALLKAEEFTLNQVR